MRNGTQQSSNTQMGRVDDEDYEEEEIDLVEETGNNEQARERKRTVKISTQEKLLAKSKMLS